jgi:superfamily I DNA/RNA helicase
VASESDAETWAGEAWLDTPPEQTTEALRVAYVALTRVERLLVVAIPQTCDDWVKDRFRAIGFAQRP